MSTFFGSISPSVQMILQYLPMMFVTIAWFIIFSRTHNAAALTLAMVKALLLVFWGVQIFVITKSPRMLMEAWYQYTGIGIFVLSWCNVLAIMVFAFTCPPAQKYQEYQNDEA